MVPVVPVVPVLTLKSHHITDKKIRNSLASSLYICLSNL